MQFQKRVENQKMIEISSNALSILYPDGTSAVFDAAELSARIARSCHDAGTADAWIADDIAFSVEFALQKHLQQSGRKSIPLAEIESCVVSILEDAGYADAAEKFLSGGRPRGEMGKITQADVHGFLLSKLQLDPEEADAVAVKVISAMHAIKAEKCSIRLILELARHFRETAAENRAAMRPVRSGKAAPPPGEIAARLPDPLRRYMDEGILKEYKKNGPDIVDIVHPAEAFIAFDGQAAQAVEQGYPGYIEAETVEELAEKLGIDTEKLQDTIDEYNEMCENGVDTKFHKPQKYLHPITGKGKYLVGKYYLAAYGTVGGVRINKYCEVLDENQMPIEGLYSAGSDANTIYGDSYNFTLPGNTMGFAINSGRMAGESVAEYIHDCEA